CHQSPEPTPWRLASNPPRIRSNRRLLPRNSVERTRAVAKLPAADHPLTTLRPYHPEAFGRGEVAGSQVHRPVVAGGAPREASPPGGFVPAVRAVTLPP